MRGGVLQAIGKPVRCGFGTRPAPLAVSGLDLLEALWATLQIR